MKLLACTNKKKTNSTLLSICNKIRKIIAYYRYDKMRLVTTLDINAFFDGQPASRYRNSNMCLITRFRSAFIPDKNYFKS